MTPLLLTLALAQPAHAGWVKDFCNRYLVTSDPYQFESHDTYGVISQFNEVRAKIWNETATAEDREYYLILRRELEMRIQYGNPAQVDKIKKALTLASSFDLTNR